jgi:hypothetical protein
MMMYKGVMQIAMREVCTMHKAAGGVAGAQGIADRRHGQ